MVNSYPPLGLGYLSAVLEGDGHEVAIYDLGLEPDTPLGPEIDRIAAFAPDLIGFTAMTNNYHNVEEAAALLRDRLGSPIVVGGPHATLYPDQVVAEPSIDYVVCGEGEETLRDLVRAMGDGGVRPTDSQLRGILGLAFASGGEATINAPRPLIEDLDSLPMPARHLFELSRYPLYASNGEPMVTLLSSRGCPYNCSYCFKGIVGRTYRQRSAQSVLAEICYLIDTYDYRHFYFIDDLFTLDVKRLTAIAEGILAEGLDIRWQCLARVDRVTPQLLALMYRSGCREIHYGIESGNADVLERVGKGFSLDRVRDAVTWTDRAGILVKGYFMLGLPGDTEETMQQTIRFASELALDEAMFSLTTPFPGTRLWDELIAQRPEIARNRDFAGAYYYSGSANSDARPNERGATPFMNLSQVSDSRLVELVADAQARFGEAVRERKYIREMGPLLGGALFAVSRNPGLRRIAHSLLRSWPLRQISRLGQFADYDWREENAAKWN